jgi:hypothetical protein
LVIVSSRFINMMLQLPLADIEAIQVLARAVRMRRALSSNVVNPALNQHGC